MLARWNLVLSVLYFVFDIFCCDGRILSCDVYLTCPLHCIITCFSVLIDIYFYCDKPVFSCGVQILFYDKHFYTVLDILSI